MSPTHALRAFALLATASSVAFGQVFFDGFQEPPTGSPDGVLFDPMGNFVTPSELFDNFGANANYEATSASVQTDTGFIEGFGQSRAGFTATFGTARNGVPRIDITLFGEATWDAPAGYTGNISSAILADLNIVITEDTEVTIVDMDPSGDIFSGTLTSAANDGVLEAGVYNISFNLGAFASDSNPFQRTDSMLTILLPTPASTAMLGLAGLATARRRR